MCVRIVFFLLSIFAIKVSSISFPHTRYKRISGDDYSDDDVYTMYGSYEDYYYETYSCKDGLQKIPLLLMCDEMVDCTDGSDEETTNCEGSNYATISPSYSVSVTAIQPQITAQEVFKPAMNIPDDYEEYQGCLEGEFQCLSDWSVCLPTAQMCDGIDDCPAREDEIGCLGKGSMENSDIDYIGNWVDSANKPALKKVRHHTQESHGAGLSEVRYTSTKPKAALKSSSGVQGIRPVFIPPKEKDYLQLAPVRPEYKYVRMKEYDCVDCRHIKKKYSNIKYSKRTRTRSTSFYHRQDREIEINHDTGEVRFLGSRRRSHPSTFALPSSAFNSYQEGAEVADENLSQLKHLRGIVSELLHHIGDMLQKDLSEDDPVPHSKNVGNRPQENGLFVRIARVKTPRLLINLQFGL